LLKRNILEKTKKESYDALLHSIVDKVPIARGTITETSGVYDKLTNTALYTASHKERFDANGVGKGASGRQVIDSNTATLNQLVNRNTNSVVPNNTYSGSTQNVSNSSSGGLAKKRGQAAIVTASSERLDLKSQQVKRVDAHSSTGSLNKGPSRSTGSLNGSNASINKPTTAKKPTTSNFAASGKTGGSGSVFDRLTNVNGYTGSHKERFNADGTGRGLQGRDTGVSKGQGTTKDLSQLLRT